ncbi:NAD(P)H-binding protein [Hydrogenophaga sp.]|uniref:NAD(P)H-binding protein n=1 Tax=Hydrogenophaga sp. TaxID=1904254 RepID=UPI00272EFE35|nr:NAD(P)H-binding protein [Hydrogenophaga sp.]MDP2075417.1 NAD(P)H-binding protein [Hydrogenophaga sp.]MDP3107436.1 NAD(P)H-binding protein [Hydrogenophaga sp.]MDP3349220.1 NAD(P)H-binding protein [Hydrogenophaga sp.]MDZ4399048.1 NAD(P)H-binding protein [Hydrogenophaga sp.]
MTTLASPARERQPPREHPSPLARTRVRVLLLGANGFIGGHVLRALLARGCEVVAVRRRAPERAVAALAEPHSWLHLQLHTLLHPEAWRLHLHGIDVVINCVGILRQRLGERYEDVHHRMPKALAQACADAGVRLIHTSALGLHEGAKSRFLSSKLHGEQAVQASGADHCIVRPSLIDGIGGFGASWLRMLASWPVHFVPRGATGRIAALQANDLAEAFAVLAHMPTLVHQREANLGGERLFAYRHYLQVLRGIEHAQPTPKALQVLLPDWVSRVGAHLCDLFRFSPFSYGHWILLQRDNMPVPNALPKLLGRAPAPVTYTRVALRDDFRLS